MDDLAFQAWMQATQQQTEAALTQFLPTEDVVPSRLHEAMRYSALDGGKRVRPLLAAAAAQLGQHDADALARALAAVEMIHVYSLVHDDMPEMDNDLLRRGKPTCHVAYDQATALLVGDALQTRAFDVLSQADGLAPARVLRMVRALAVATGSEGMAGGQAIDLANVGQMLTQAQLEHMHGLKTGALIRVAVVLGGLSCPELTDAQLTQLDDYGRYLGLAFQVIDDVLDVAQDTATLGKTAGKDEANDKPTYVKLLGLNEARGYAEGLAEQAIKALSGFGPRAEILENVARYVVFRQH
ncbi:MAG: polyprenyl synthetase family protein [Neisseriaceae bacterium]|nr:polyprenyl synthetase family protein [Neisseriaceae bacterium]